MQNVTLFTAAVLNLGGGGGCGKTFILKSLILYICFDTICIVKSAI